MKLKINQDTIYSLIYYAIAIATAKHSAWSYSTAMEGAQPAMDWANFSPDFAGLWALGGLLTWFAWGLLAAIAIDVGMFLVAKNIRETRDRNLLGMYLTYGMVAFFSAYFQVMYALQHAAQFAPVEGVPEWVNIAYVWRFLIVPVSLPVMSIGYTLFVKIDEARNKPKLGTVDKNLGTKVFSVKEAAEYTKYSDAWIRQRYYKSLQGGPAFGHQDENGRVVFTKEELDAVKRE